MPFDWNAYLDLARELSQPTGDASKQEAMLRSAVSRAYFAAYCHARNYATRWLKFQPTHEADDHGNLRNHFRRDGKRRGLAQKLDDLRQWRNNADYDDTFAGDLAACANSAVSKAKTVIDCLPPPKVPAAS